VPEQVVSHVQQVVQRAGLGACRVPVTQGVHQLAVFALVGQTALGRDALLFQLAPVALGAHLFHELEHAGDKAVVRSVGNGFVQFAVPVLELFQTGGFLGVAAAGEHAGEIGGGGVAHHQVDDGRLQRQARFHQLGRAGVLRGVLTDLAVQAGAGLLRHKGAAAHGLLDQALLLQIGERPAHGGAAHAVALCQLALGGQAVTAFPVPFPQLGQDGFAQRGGDGHGGAKYTKADQFSPSGSEPMRIGKNPLWPCLSLV